MRIQTNHWLDDEDVELSVLVLAALVFGISAVTFVALNL
jgi:hypothetical protein